jgi:hypothetical protein
MKQTILIKWKHIAVGTVTVTIVYLLYRNARAAEAMADMMREALLEG